MTVMSAAFKAIATTRPRIKRDVLFTETREGVLFHNTQGGFHLAAKSAYRFASLIVPYLNGEHRVVDLCEGLPDSQRAMVADLVRALLERGYARDVAESGEQDGTDLPAEVGEHFAAQIAYVDHYEDRPAERFRRFREARVAVLGDDLVARWCALSLLRNGAAAVHVDPALDRRGDGVAALRSEAAELTAQGVPSEVLLLPAGDTFFTWDDLDDFDTVVCCGSTAAGQVFRLLEAGVPRGRRLLSATAFGDRAVVGPLMTDESPCCWVCAMLRLGAGAGSGEAADVWSAVCLPGAGLPAAAPGRNLSAMLGNLIGYEVFREHTQVLPADTDGRVLIQDFESLDTVAEWILPHPRCPFCRGKEGVRDAAEATAAELAGLVPVAPAVTTAVTADDADALVDELNDRSVLVAANGGVFTRFDDDTPTQLPLKVTRVELATGGGRRRSIAAFDVHHVAGARLRALRSATAVYAEHVVPQTGVLRADALERARTTLRSVDPRQLSTASGLPVSEDNLDGWVAGASLLHGDQVLVPAAAVRPFGPGNRAMAFERTSAGLGVGDTAAEAAYQGLFSALAHGAVRQATAGARKARRVPAAAFAADPELTFLTASAANLGLDAELLDLTGPAPAPGHVLLARAVDPATGEPRWAVAADSAWRRAATAALRDLVGGCQLSAELSGDEPLDLGDPLLDSFDAGVLAVADGPAPETDAVTPVPQLLDRLRDAGRDVVVVSNTSADLRSSGMVAVRVLLTGGRA